jgi:fucose permease
MGDATTPERSSGAGTGVEPAAPGTERHGAGAVVDLGRARRATSAFFLLVGVVLATWAALVPFAKARHGLDEASLGTILLAFGCGTIASTLAAAPLIRRYGSRATLVVAGSGLCAFVPFLAVAPSAVALAVLLFGFGAFTGVVGVAANAQAIAVQAASGRPLMSSFHALFSVGGLVGASLSSFLLKLGVPIELCAVVIPAALLAFVATEHRGLVADGEPGAGRAARRTVPPMPVVVVGLMTLSLYLAEGAVLDWGAVFLHESRGYSVSTAALGYAAFSVAMAAGRLLGDRIVARLGPVTVVRYGTALAAAGFAVFVLAPGRASGLVGCALIGLGASNVVPTLISASARVSDFPTGAAVSTVVAMGTCGLIAGPALIGFVAQTTSLSAALAGLAALLVAVGAAARVVGPTRGAA